MTASIAEKSSAALTGFATYAARHLGPYVRAAVGQFSSERVTLTERFLERKTTKGHSS